MSFIEPFTSVIRFISRNVIYLLFEAILNGVAFLVSFPACLLLVHRRAAPFCVMCLYPAPLWKEFISSKSFLVGATGSPI